MAQVDGTVSTDAARVESFWQNLAARVQTLLRLAFAATIILIPFRMRLTLLARPQLPIYGDYTDLLLFASDILLVATLALWLASLALEPRRVKTGPSFLSIPIAGVTVLALVSVVSSVDPVISIDNAIRLVLLGGLYLFVLNEITSINYLILPVAIQIAIQSVVGIAQVLQQHSIGLPLLQELNLDPAWSGVSIVSAEGVRSLRAYGLSDHPNILGGCLAFGLLMIATLYAGTETRWHAVMAGVFALGAVALLLTFSRAAWLAFAGGAVFCAFVFWRTRQRAAIVRWFNLAGASALLLLPFVWHNAPYLGARLDAGNAFSQVAIETRSLVERDRLAQAAFQIFGEHPLLGIGVGALPQAEQIRYPDFGAFNAYYQPAHFVLLDVAAETGVIGALFYFAAMLAPWLALWLNRRRLIFSPALIGISGVLLAVTLVGFFDYYTWLLAPGRLWQWLVWGVWAMIYSRSFGEPDA